MDLKKLLFFVADVASDCARKLFVSHRNVPGQMVLVGLNEPDERVDVNLVFRSLNSFQPDFDAIIESIRAIGKVPNAHGPFFSFQESVIPRPRSFGSVNRAFTANTWAVPPEPVASGSTGCR